MAAETRALEDQLASNPILSAFETAAQLLEAQRATLLLRDAVEPVLMVAASKGLEPRLAASIRVPIGEGIAGLVAKKGDALLGAVDGETFLSIPIATELGVEGVLNVTSRRDGRDYTTREMALARTAAAHIGRLIQYSRNSARDSLSGLHARGAFDEMLEREVARCARIGGRLAVAFLDLDDLKGINDRLGHPKGDEAIKAVGKVIQRVMRPYDVAGRYGGDEFIILLTGLDESNATDVATGVAQRISDAATAVSRDIRIPLSASIGIAHWPDNGTTAHQLVAFADRKMYEEKRAKKMRRGSSSA